MAALKATKSQIQIAAIDDLGAPDTETAARLAAAKLHGITIPVDLDPMVLATFFLETVSSVAIASGVSSDLLRLPMLRMNECGGQRFENEHHFLKPLNATNLWQCDCFSQKVLTLAGIRDVFVRVPAK